MVVCHACGTGRACVCCTAPTQAGVPACCCQASQGMRNPCQAWTAAHFQCSPPQVWEEDTTTTHIHVNSCSAALGSPVKASATAVLPQCPQQFSCLVSPPPHYPIGQQGWWFPTRRPPSSFHRFAACLLGPPPQVKVTGARATSAALQHPTPPPPLPTTTGPPPHPSVLAVHSRSPACPLCPPPRPHTTHRFPFSAAPSWPATAGPGRWPGAPPAGTPAG